MNLISKIKQFKSSSKYFKNVYGKDGEYKSMGEDLRHVVFLDINMYKVETAVSLRQTEDQK